MATRIDDIMKEIRRLISDPHFSSSREIAQAHREICRIASFDFLKRTSEELISIESGKTTYVLDSLRIRRLERIWVWGGTEDPYWKELACTPAELFEEKVRESRDNDGNDEQATPKYYRIEGGPYMRITVTPTPDADLAARVDYIAATESITRDSDPATPEEYDDIIAMLAAGYVLERKAETRELGMIYQTRAGKNAEAMVRDVQAVRTVNFDKPTQKWLL